MVNKMSPPCRWLDISNAVVFTPETNSAQEEKAVSVFVEEVDRRTGLTLKLSDDWPVRASAVIAVGTVQRMKPYVENDPEVMRETADLGPEGYSIQVIERNNQHIIVILGADSRGMLYGVGKLLRNLQLRTNCIQLEPRFRITSTPRFPLRGHQLGYRPKTNAYDAWLPQQFDQYIRELALFGANSIEILPPRTDDDETGPHIKVNSLEMMVQLSEMIHSYGLDTWVWYPNMADDYTDPATIQEELAEREEIFKRVPYIHAVLIPGGDPGDVEADLLFDWSAQVAQLLQKYHPNAKVWLSPQVMRNELINDWLQNFYANVRKEPDWLGGIVFGPWEKHSLPELRKIIPNKYPIRRYEDICHNFRSQYPVHHWDVAFALTYGRESINPRPVAHKQIHNEFAEYSVGNISYSEGIYDDVNKFVWADQDWNPDAPVIETLRDYARFFIGCDFTEGFAQGLLALERNWSGSLAANDAVDVTFLQWQAMERAASQPVLKNYRFQMALLRAYYDAYQRRRLINETALEQQAMEVLQNARTLGAVNALNQMEEILRRTTTQPVAQEYRRRCEELADELFESIGAQTTIERHQAIALERGAFMTAVATPLNNMPYLLVQSGRIRNMNNEADRLKAIHELIHRTDPGPGGYYDNFGSPKSLSRVNLGVGWEKDPGHLATPRINYSDYLLHIDQQAQVELGGIPLSWLNSVSAIYDVPLKVAYGDLNPNGHYMVRIVYTSKKDAPYRVKMIANEEFVVHDAVTVCNVTVVEVPIPAEALREGTVEFNWVNLGGDRGRDIAEILIKAL